MAPGPWVVNKDICFGFTKGRDIRTFCSAFFGLSSQAGGGGPSRLLVSDFGKEAKGRRGLRTRKYSEIEIRSHWPGGIWSLAAKNRKL